MYPPKNTPTKSVNALNMKISRLEISLKSLCLALHIDRLGICIIWDELYMMELKIQSQLSSSKEPGRFLGPH